MVEASDGLSMYNILIVRVGKDIIFAPKMLNYYGTNKIINFPILVYCSL